MAIPTFQEFDWLHPQPSWAYEPDYREAVRVAGARYERWMPLWRLLFYKGGARFSDYQVGALIRLKDEYEGGVTRKG